MRKTSYRGFARMLADRKKLPEAPKLPKIAEIEKQKPVTEALRIGDWERHEVPSLIQGNQRNLSEFIYLREAKAIPLTRGEPA